jgi:hypothetical protein
MKPVTVIRYVMGGGSIEEKIVHMQLAKAALSRGALNRLSQVELRQARVAEMKSLFDL